MARITVLIPDGDSSQEIIFSATGWIERPGSEGDKPMPPTLDLYAGKRVVASFPFGMWLGVWYADRKAQVNDRRF
jgi:hypothetical protein